MEKYVGVFSSISPLRHLFNNYDYIKRAAFIFDEIIYIDLNKFINTLENLPYEKVSPLSPFAIAARKNLDNLKLLRDSGIIRNKEIDILQLFYDDDEREQFFLNDDRMHALLKIKPDSIKSTIEKIAIEEEKLKLYSYQNDFYTRIASGALNNIERKSIYVPIFAHQGKDWSYFPQKQSLAKTEVLSVALELFPTPKNDVPIEQIIEFKSDPDSKGRFLGLRNWISDVSRKKLTKNELEEKLQWELHKYTEHLKLHRLKTEMSRLETFIVTGAEILESIATLKFSNAAKSLFSISKQEIYLMEQELKAPGRELSYIHNAKMVSE